MTRTTRTRTADGFFDITGIKYHDQLAANWWRLRPEDLAAYVGDDVWVRPDGTFVVDDDDDQDDTTRTTATTPG